MLATVKVAIQWDLALYAKQGPLRGFYYPGPRPRLLSAKDRQAGILKTIEMRNLRDRLKVELENRLPVHAGQRIAKEDWEKVQRAVVGVDEHLELKLVTAGSQGDVPELILQIFHPKYVPPAAAATATTATTEEMTITRWGELNVLAANNLWQARFAHSLRKRNR